MSASPDRTRKRFARRQWRRRWQFWRYIVASLLLVGLVAGSVWVLYFSTLLTVAKVSVDGESTLPEKQVLAVAAVPAGEQLIRLDTEAIANRLRALATIRSADVSRAWPDGVRIIVRERVAVAVVDLNGTLRGLDADGVLFNTYPKPPPGLPLVTSNSATSTAALKEAATVVGAMPSTLAVLVDHVEVASIDQISLALRDGRTVIWGSSEESDLKAQVLAKLLRSVQAEVYDVSVPGNPTTRGAAAG